jgi:type IV secretion system protein VirB11
MSIKALERHLLPLVSYLKTPGVTEICINKPQEIYVEQDGRFTFHKIDELEYSFLDALASLVAEFNNKDFPSPLISGSLPTGERIQFVTHPACENKQFVCAIRRHAMREMSLEDYENSRAFDGLATVECKDKEAKVLKSLYHKKRFLNFLKSAIRLKKNILISGGTGTGKTTFLNACLKEILAHERILTIEDTREVAVLQPNAAHLLFNEEDKRITALIIFKVCLRLRPDRIFLSELRGAEVWPYLRAANSGHPGSLSTVHADTPEGAITQLVFMMQQAGSTSTEPQIRAYIKSIIPIVVQLKRCSDEKRFMCISEIYFDQASINI